jgi:hypothetical protein
MTLAWQSVVTASAATLLVAATLAATHACPRDMALVAAGKAWTGSDAAGRSGTRGVHGRYPAVGTDDPELPERRGGVVVSSLDQL